jgi:hypothetical protein
MHGNLGESKAILKMANQIIFMREADIPACRRAGKDFVIINYMILMGSFTSPAGIFMLDRSILLHHLDFVLYQT